MPSTTRCRRSSAPSCTKRSPAGSSARRGRPAELDEFVGYHLERSYRYRGGARSRRRRRPRGRRSRGTHLLAAGDRALGRGDVAAAEQLLGRAMALLPADDPRALSAMPSLGQVLFYGGQLERAAEFLDGAAVRAADAGADTVVARVAIQRALISNHLVPEFAIRSALVEIEGHMAPLVAADDDLGLAEGCRSWGCSDSGSATARGRWRPSIERTPTPSVPDRSGSCD